ncbi:pyridoxal phosphate-dependent decarboxylase family protein [Halocynthiibacter styelae]|uniref:Aspartate aminotransferase family protein n=1 Tax=Halocynthiibacter styelae TaxID=2761955 RepID=A0A8J7IDF1_9RHOB|nr:pyridoxal-dependent decarboxylase [Paenihalocynthiibacter styelae]MBI1494383.1 aspartate aminotransferase family protein [Paenihalocynthiibacter styelae]
MKLDKYTKLLPKTGMGEQAAYDLLSHDIKVRSANLGSDIALAHMDPPTPGIASKLVGLNAQFNQNLLHPDLSPFATDVERRLIEWLAPVWGMADGHMCGGSTLANLTALWCARETGATRVVASVDAHLSVAKAAHILAMEYQALPVDGHGRIELPKMADLSNTCLVLTAGTTGRGMVDPLGKTGALWTHVDAAWAGPLKLSKHASLLDGIEDADSISISAHKWFFQPKDSALILFSDTESQDLVSFGGDYLAVPNIGVQGSRGAAAIPLLATLLAWGQDGLAQRIEHGMDMAEHLADFLQSHPKAELKQMPETGVVNWRPTVGSPEYVLRELGESASSTKINGELWLRHVAANSHADVDLVSQRIERCLR